jgi:hypothetical protein
MPQNQQARPEAPREPVGGFFGINPFGAKKTESETVALSKTRLVLRKASGKAV